MGLQYRTRGMRGPRREDGVYLCCHPEETACLDALAEEILESQDCTLWYGEPPVPLDGEWQSKLKDIQLIVLAVTEKLLTTPNPAMDEIYPFAQEWHIPVLPLLRQTGLEGMFNEKCDQLHCLNAALPDDPTAIPYREKLKKFLSTVLVKDEMIEKVQNAFDAYIFLSYRKKDRREAQRLMRLIHQNERLRDVAIWYDEFLIPGENFNTSIARALERSDLFALAVTPNLLAPGPDGKPNYVMGEEYPIAKGQKPIKEEKEKCVKLIKNKKILPVRMEPVDETALREKYEDLPGCVDASEPRELTKALLENLSHVALMSHSGEPRHSFFMALAYLNGIDVEKNAVQAEKLLQEAVEGDIPEACVKLADMYYLGIGVERDYNRALDLRQKAAELFRAVRAQDPDDLEKARCLRDALEAVVDLRRELGYPHIEALWEWEAACREGAERFGTAEDKQELRRCLYNMSEAGGDVIEESWRDKRMECCREALELTKALALESGELSDRLWVSKCLRRLGELLYNEKGAPDHKAAAEQYERALEQDRRSVDETDDVSALRSLAEDHSRLGGDGLGEYLTWEQRAEHYREALEALLRVEERTGDLRDRRRVCQIREDLAEVCQGKEAQEQDALARKGYRQIAEETDSLWDWLAFAGTYVNKLQVEGKEECRRLFDEADQLLQGLAKKWDHPQVYALWTDVCFAAGEKLGDEGLIEKGDGLGKLLSERFSQGVHGGFYGLP